MALVITLLLFLGQDEKHVVKKKTRIRMRRENLIKELMEFVRAGVFFLLKHTRVNTIFLFATSFSAPIFIFFCSFLGKLLGNVQHRKNEIIHRFNSLAILPTPCIFCVVKFFVAISAEFK